VGLGQTKLFTILMFYRSGTKHRSVLLPIADRSVAACAWWCWNAFIGFEDAVIETLFPCFTGIVIGVNVKFW